MTTISENRLKKLQDPDYRSEYMRATVTGWVAHQLRALREQRRWTQTDLGYHAGGKPQSAIARYESEDYGNWSASTLYELAEAFDVALQIRFVPWTEFLDWTKDTSPRRMYVSGFDPSAFATPSALPFGSHVGWTSGLRALTTLQYEPIVAAYRPYVSLYSWALARSQRNVGLQQPQLNRRVGGVIGSVGPVLIGPREAATDPQISPRAGLN